MNKKRRELYAAKKTKNKNINIKYEKNEKKLLIFVINKKEYFQNLSNVNDEHF